jgi:hypothetical protein
LKLPTMEQALGAIRALGEGAGYGAQIKAAEGLVGIVTDLFADRPQDQAALKSAYEEQMARTDAALDRLDAAIDGAKG